MDDGPSTPRSWQREPRRGPGGSSGSDGSSSGDDSGSYSRGGEVPDGRPGGGYSRGGGGYNRGGAGYSRGGASAGDGAGTTAAAAAAADTGAAGREGHASPATGESSLQTVRPGLGTARELSGNHVCRWEQPDNHPRPWLLNPGVCRAGLLAVWQRSPAAVAALGPAAAQMGPGATVRELPGNCLGTTRELPGNPGVALPGVCRAGVATNAGGCSSDCSTNGGTAGASRGNRPETVR